MDATPSTSNGSKKERAGAPQPIAPPTPPKIDYTTHLFDAKEVYESPLNPRRTFGDLEDLAKDIGIRGIIEPLVVRPRKAGGYEIAAGARRFRASKIARLETLPCLVRTLTDAELVELAISENGKRSDLHPIEEAEGFEKLKTEYGYTVEMLATKFQKSVSHVYQHLKLLALCDAARKAFYEGRLDLVVAIKLARVPGSDLQKQALRDLNVESDFQRPTAKQALEILQRKYMLRLIDAPFDRANPALVAGAPACAACPKRTGFQPELFADVKSPDLCTDPTCFEKKKNAGWATRIAQAKTEGVEIKKEVLPDYASAPAGYVTLDQKPYDDAKQRTFRTLLRSDMPEKPDAIVRREDGKILELYKESAVKKKLVELGHKFAKPKPKPKAQSYYGSKPETPAQKEKRALDDKIAARTVAAQTQAIVAAAVKKDPTHTFWMNLIEHWQEYGDGYYIEDVLNRRGHKVGEHSWSSRKLTAKVEAVLKRMGVPELRGVLVELLVGSEYAKDVRASFATLYGIDLKEIAKLAKEAVQAEAKKEAEAKPAKKTDDQKRGGKKTTAKKGASR